MTTTRRISTPMNATRINSTQGTSARSDRRIVAGLIGLGLVPAVSGVVRLVGLATGATVTPANARFHDAPLPVTLHIVTALLFSIVGSLQFSSTFRARRRRLHRAAGWLLAPCGIVVALTGLWMAHFYRWPAGDGLVVYAERLLFGSAMLGSIVWSLVAIGRRDVAAHGAWMTRGYAIGLGAGTQTFTHLPWFLLSDAAPSELARGIMMGAGWVINVAAAEWFIRRRMPGPVTKRISHSGVIPI